MVPNARIGNLRNGQVVGDTEEETGVGETSERKAAPVELPGVTGLLRCEAKLAVGSRVIHLWKALNDRFSARLKGVIALYPGHASVSCRLHIFQRLDGEAWTNGERGAAPDR